MFFNVVQRQAARAIVLTPEWDVLLMLIRAPQGGDPFWITPGGGLEPDETMEEALRRELREELGLERCEIGPLVWRDVPVVGCDTNDALRAR